MGSAWLVTMQFIGIIFRSFLIKFWFSAKLASTNDLKWAFKRQSFHPNLEIIFVWKYENKSCLFLSAWGDFWANQKWNRNKTEINFSDCKRGCMVCVCFLQTSNVRFDRRVKIERKKINKRGKVFRRRETEWIDPNPWSGRNKTCFVCHQDHVSVCFAGKQAFEACLLEVQKVAFILHEQSARLCRRSPEFCRHDSTFIFDSTAPNVQRLWCSDDGKDNGSKAGHAKAWRCVAMVEEAPKSWKSKRLCCWLRKQRSLRSNVFWLSKRLSTVSVQAWESWDKRSVQYHISGQPDTQNLWGFVQRWRFEDQRCCQGEQTGWDCLLGTIERLQRHHPLQHSNNSM